MVKVVESSENRKMRIAAVVAAHAALVERRHDVLLKRRARGAVLHPRDDGVAFVSRQHRRHRPAQGRFEARALKLTETDTGAGIATLVRVSHIHLFGLTFLFFIVGLMFSHAYVRPVWLKCAIVGLPFVAIVLDVSSWYFTKLYHPFAYVVMLGGALMATCFAFMWLVTMYQLWFTAPPPIVTQRTRADVPVIG